MKVTTKKEKVKALSFTLPALSIYILFLIVPMLGALYFAFFDWNGIKGAPLIFVGLDNFLNVFQDKDFLIALKNMFLMVFFSVLFHTPIALLLAVAINKKFKGNRFFKIIFFVPTIFPLTAIGLLWYFIFMPNGSLNSLLQMIGLDSLVTGWLVNPSTAMAAIIFVNIWAGVGYYMVILLAGLTTIPNEVYEAAEMDGATSVQKFFYITIPMLKPIITLCILMDIIGTVKVFDLIFVMTEGGPNGLTNLPTTLMYYEAFKYNNYGIGSALGIIIFVIALVLTVGSEFIMNRKEKANEK